VQMPPEEGEDELDFHSAGEEDIEDLLGGDVAK
jgi:hypothetical protein